MILQQFTLIQTKCSTFSNFSMNIFNIDQSRAVRGLPLLSEGPAMVMGRGHFQLHTHQNLLLLGPWIHLIPKSGLIGPFTYLGLWSTNNWGPWSLSWEEQTPLVSKDPVTGLPNLYTHLYQGAQDHTSFTVWEPSLKPIWSWKKAAGSISFVTGPRHFLFYFAKVLEMASVLITFIVRTSRISTCGIIVTSGIFRKHHVKFNQCISFNILTVL